MDKKFQKKPEDAAQRMAELLRDEVLEEDKKNRSFSAFLGTKKEGAEKWKTE